MYCYYRRNKLYLVQFIDYYLPHIIPVKQRLILLSLNLDSSNFFKLRLSRLK